MAQGEKGVYDIDADTVVLTGSVVLIRGDSVIRGDRLEMNLATGVSRVLSAGLVTGGDGRVKALFVPSSDNSE
jgi:lipopolysaccharide export system protein LptA